MGVIRDWLLFWRSGGQRTPAGADDREETGDLPCRPPNVTDWVPAQAPREDPAAVKARIMKTRGVAYRRMVVDPQRCTACGHCAEVCPDGAITVTTIKSIDEQRCSTCGCCVSVCPSHAISIDEGEDPPP
jgi:ferredoxin